VKDAIGRHPKSFERTMDFNSIYSILRAGWDMPARGWSEGRNCSTVKIHREQNYLNHYPS
jgi:hypothetical protein